MKGNMHRIAINFGPGYVAGLNAVVTGAMLAARQLGWTVVGIRDGFDGLMFPDRYPGGGLVELQSGAPDARFARVVNVNWIAILHSIVEPMRIHAAD